MIGLHGRGVARACLLLLVTGCAQMRPEPDFAEARRLVSESTGQEEVFDPYAPLIGRDEIDVMLTDGLTLDEALRLTLTNSRELQAEFLSIGVAHADWVQSKLLSNPVFDLRVPFTGSDGTLEGVLGFELLELWRIPVRVEGARHALDATVLRVARRAGERLADVKNAYFAAVSAETLAAVAEEHAAVVARSYAAVQELQRAGSADAFDENLAQGPVLAAQLDLRAARLEAATKKRELAKRLSIDWPVSALRLIDPLPEPAERELDAEALVRQAEERRLDLRAMSKAIESLAARVTLERRRAWGDAGAGPSLERLGDGASSVGGTLSVTVPLFDQNQAQVARAEFELEQMRALYDGVRVDVAQDVRTAVDRLSAALESASFHREQLRPQAERSLALAQDSYAAGRATLFVLLDSQQRVLETRRGLVIAALEAASALANLERVVGRPSAEREPEQERP